VLGLRYWVKDFRTWDVGFTLYGSRFEVQDKRVSFGI